MTAVAIAEKRVDKGLKSGALSLVSNIVIGVASTAPAYSLAATLGAIAALVGLISPLVVLIAFVPMLFVSIGYSELNKADPDCGTTFTWASRAFAPWAGWLGGWGILASDILVMASLAEVASIYTFNLFNASSIANATSGPPWVLLLGLVFIGVMTWVCYRGIEVSARLQRVLLSIEVIMLMAFGLVALIRVLTGNAPAGHITPSLNWFNPGSVDFSTLISGLLLMLFIYWGWDTSVSINEETADRTRNPGRAAIISTVLLLVMYFVVTLGAQSFAGVGTKGTGLANPNNVGDVISVLGTAVFGASWFGQLCFHLLLLMVLSSAAASAQTTILPTARTMLSMAVYKGLPDSFARMHPRYFTPTVSTLVMGGVSAALYVLMNYLVTGGLVISDAVTAIGIWIAFYYGLTGFTCFWYYRKTLLSSARNLFMRGVFPLLGGLMLYFALVFSVGSDFNADTVSFTTWTLPFGPRWVIGGVFLIALVSAVVGLIIMVAWWIARPPFFRGEVLNRSTPTLVPEEGTVARMSS
ncbi:MAG TPA: APC family permease [Candidatus Binatia bacterium]|nr:APC family permease [Candidatus Binatia bacterium]